MLQTVYYDPFRVFETSSRARKTRAHKDSYWRPDVDIVESQEQYQLLLDLPGIDPETIDVTEDKKVLTIKAEKVALELDEAQQVTRSERRSGVYQRQFTLPEDADVGSIKAESKNGVLQLSIKRQQPQETLRKIEVTQ